VKCESGRASGQPADALWPVHTATIVAQIGDCCQNQRLLPNSATVAVFGDKLSPKSATIVSSVDRPLHVYMSSERRAEAIDSVCHIINSLYALQFLIYSTFELVAVKTCSMRRFKQKKTASTSENGIWFCVISLFQFFISCFRNSWLKGPA